MTLEELASWHEEMAAYAEAIGRKDCRKNSLAAAAACRELQDKRANITGYKGKSDTRAELEAETDRLLAECK